MRGPAIATGVVLIAGVGMSLQRRSQIAAYEQEFSQILREAEAQGIPLDRRVSSSRGLRASGDRRTGRLAEDLKDLLGRAEQIERAGGSVDDELRERLVDLSAGLAMLSPRQFRIVMDGLRESRGISDATKAKVIGMSILHITADRPQQALRLLEDCNGIIGKGGLTDHIATSAMEAWAKSDPSAAMHWLNDSKSLPGGTRMEEMAEALLGGAAQSDPATAFRMLEELKGLDMGSACEVIASSSSGTEAARNALISAMREHLEPIEDSAQAEKIVSSVMETLGSGISGNSFEEVSGWLSGQDFSGDELASFADGLSWFTTGSRTGDWLQWIADHVPDDRIAEPVEGLMGDWVEEDYIAAGKWLSSAPDGPMKPHAVMSYAEAVAEYDPEVAAQWAMTLHDESMRRKTLRAIHENWPEGDEDGAARFASRHGLE